MAFRRRGPAGWRRSSLGQLGYAKAIPRGHGFGADVPPAAVHLRQMRQRGPYFVQGNARELLARVGLGLGAHPQPAREGRERGGGVSGDQAQPRGHPRRCRCRDRFHTGNTVGHALRRQRALLGGDVFGRLGCGGQGRPLRRRGKAAPGRFGSRSVDFSIGLPLRGER